jgi:hypothetical protein
MIAGYLVSPLSARPRIWLGSALDFSSRAISFDSCYRPQVCPGHRILPVSARLAAAEAAVKGAMPMADIGYKVPLVRGILEETLTALSG